MPTLEWIGKEKIINHHLEVPFRVFGRLTGGILSAKQALIKGE